MVTAELAVASLVLAGLVVLLVGLLSVLVVDLRCIDSAAQIARQLARGDVMAADAARRTAPSFSQVSVETTTASVTVVVTASVALVGTLLPPVVVRAEQTALREDR